MKKKKWQNDANDKSKKEAISKRRRFRNFEVWKRKRATVSYLEQSKQTGV